MAKATPETIFLKGAHATPFVKEREAAEIISPGHLVELQSTGKLEKMDAAVTAQSHVSAIALENDMVGKEITGAYASGEWVRYAVLQPGDEVYARLRAAAPAVALGDALENHTDGTVAKVTTGVPRFVALEAVNNSGGGSEAFIKVECIR